ncbi:histidine-containing phosphotransfer protein 1-like isoform X2 [Triticum dicoccoides]|nr:histidine-containing phosphotransfer protein 1-like isoform X2 [Triticum dicoccoides]
MAAPMLNQPNGLLANMFAAGLLDDQFQELQMLQEGSAPDFIVKVVSLFCEDGERIIGEIAKLLDKPCVDYDKVGGFVHQLKGSSASLGAQRVKNSCIQFQQCCQEKSRDGCLNSLQSVRNNFYDLCSMFKPHASAVPAGPGLNPKV